MKTNLNINRNLPLLICDADEVLFEFMLSFDEFLIQHNMYFSYSSFKLNGNILDKNSNHAIDSSNIPSIISKFFSIYAIKMPLIKGAKSTLKELSKVMNIVILSNIPKDYASNRIKCLKDNDMNYQFISNNGSKANKCMELEKLTDKNVFFIDDLPNQLSSVKNNCKNIITIHFLQNKKLLRIIPEVKNCDYKTNNWRNIKQIIYNNI